MPVAASRVVNHLPYFIHQGWNVVRHAVFDRPFDSTAVNTSAIDIHTRAIRIEKTQIFERIPVHNE